MEFWRFILDVLIILHIFTGSVSAVRSVTVKLHHTAVLPCTDRCSGVGRWTLFHKSSEPLAQCDQKSCRSVKEGYQMIYNQYLQGNFSLIITDADFSKRGYYIFDCDGRDFCDVSLRIEALESSVQVKPGGSLLLYLNLSEPMEVIYNRTGEAGRSSGRVCSVDGRSSDCGSGYSQRASVLSALELRGMEETDSGVYTIRDFRNEEAVHTYTVTVRDGGDGSEVLDQVDRLFRSRRSSEFNCPPSVYPESPAAGVPVWVVVLLVVLLVLQMVSCVVGAEKIVKLKTEIRFWNKPTNKETQHNGVPPNNPEQQIKLTEDTV